MVFVDEKVVIVQRCFGYGLVLDGWCKFGFDVQEMVFLQFDGVKYFDNFGFLVFVDIICDLCEWQKQVCEVRMVMVFFVVSVMNVFGVVFVVMFVVIKVFDVVVVVVIIVDNKEIFKQKNEFVCIQFENEVVYCQQMVVIFDCFLIEWFMDFWFGYFCIFCFKGEEVCVFVGFYECEVICFFVIGWFCDMLGVVMYYLVMFVYFDNYVFFGLNFKVGLKQKKGLNENFGCELFELYMVGVKVGYNQVDVMNVVCVIIGWGIVGDKDLQLGMFKFELNWYELGVFIVMNMFFVEGGEVQGEVLFDMLVVYLVIVQYVVDKLVCYFVGDKVLLVLVQIVVKCFQDMQGDFWEIVIVFVKVLEVWSVVLVKVILFYDMVICCECVFVFNMDLKRVVNFVCVFG